MIMPVIDIDVAAKQSSSPVIDIDDAASAICNSASSNASSRSSRQRRYVEELKCSNCRKPVLSESTVDDITSSPMRNACHYDLCRACLATQTPLAPRGLPVTPCTGYSVSSSSPKQDKVQRTPSSRSTSRATRGESTTESSPQVLSTRSQRSLADLSTRSTEGYGRSLSSPPTKSHNSCERSHTLRYTPAWCNGFCDMCSAPIKSGHGIGQCESCQPEWWVCAKCAGASGADRFPKLDHVNHIKSISEWSQRVLAPKKGGATTLLGLEELHQTRPLPKKNITGKEALLDSIFDDLSKITQRESRRIAAAVR